VSRASKMTRLAVVIFGVLDTDLQGRNPAEPEARPSDERNPAEPKARPSGRAERTGRLMPARVAG
jgi:hypothetical protein